MTFSWIHQAARVPDAAAIAAARSRQAELTKPPGSLGCLEDVAVRLAGLQRGGAAPLEHVRIAVFAGDHGIATENVSSFPQSVTVEMVRNFARGGAAISVLARELGAVLEVINVGTVGDPGELPGVFDRRVAAGTRNIVHEPAMTREELARAMQAGAEAVERADRDGAQLFIGGEMGIGNTSVASAVACALLDLPACAMVGPGTGLDRDGVAHKARTVDAALARHGGAATTPLEVLRCLGGFEIAALVGAYLRCAQIGLPVLVDGFICSAAALAAARFCPTAGAWFFFGHNSAEPGHARMLRALDARPLLDLGMRLGEGSGAALAVPLLRMAAVLHRNMATFTEAGVSGANA